MIPDYLGLKAEYNRLLLFSESYEETSRSDEITRHASVSVVCRGSNAGKGSVCLKHDDAFDYAGFREFTLERTMGITGDKGSLVIFPEGRRFSAQFFRNYEYEGESEGIAFRTFGESAFGPLEYRYNALISKVSPSQEAPFHYILDFSGPDSMGYFMELFAKACGQLD